MSKVRLIKKVTCRYCHKQVCIVERLRNSKREVIVMELGCKNKHTKKACLIYLNSIEVEMTTFTHRVIIRKRVPRGRRPLGGDPLLKPTSR